VDGPTFFNRLRILLHDRGEGFLLPNPRWKDDEIAQKAMAVRDVIFALVIDAAETKAKTDRTAYVSPVCCNRMVYRIESINGDPAPTHLFRLIMGTSGVLGTSGYKYVLPLGVMLGGAMPDADAVWIAGGVFRGTARSCVYYAHPTSIISPTAPEFGDFADGFYDAVITHTAIELIMGEPMDAADRLDDLSELLFAQLGGLV